MNPKARYVFSPPLRPRQSRRHGMRGRERGRKRGLVEQRLDGTCSVGAGDHDRMGSRAALARPGLATDVTSSDLLLNIMDPLVKLGADLEQPASPRAGT